MYLGRIKKNQAMVSYRFSHESLPPAMAAMAWLVPWGDLRLPELRLGRGLAQLPSSLRAERAGRVSLGRPAATAGARAAAEQLGELAAR